MSAPTAGQVYEAAAGVWSVGPDRVYGVLARALLARGPDWRGLSVLDVGAGSGTASRRLTDAGARVVAMDRSVAMLLAARSRLRCSVAAGDALRLPVRSQSVDAVVLGFVLNHLEEPGVALAEAARVVHPGGWVLASTWARDGANPVRELVEDCLRLRGWVTPQWYVDFKQRTAPLSDTAETIAAACAGAGLTEVDARQVEVTVDCTPAQLVEWRLGMPQHAPFVAAMPSAERAALRVQLVADAAALPPMVCSTVMVSARRRD